MARFGNKVIFLLLTVMLGLFTHCSSIKNALSLLEQCLDFTSSETNSSLNEDCRALEDFLPDNQDNLADQTKILGVRPSGASTDAALFITDSSGNAIQGLAADDIEASASNDGGETFEDIPISDFSSYEDLAGTEPGTTHVSFATIIDYSGSILDNDLEFVTDGLTFLYENLTSNFRSEVVKFSTEVEVVQDFTGDASDLLAAVQDESFARDLTSLYDGMLQGIQDTADESTSLRLAILFTDGLDNDSSATYDEVKEAFQENEIPVCVVGVSFADIDLLEQIADDSGCFFIYRTVFDDLEGAFETVVDEVDNLYRVRFDGDDLEGFDTLKLNITASDGDREVTSSL